MEHNTLLGLKQHCSTFTHKAFSFQVPFQRYNQPLDEKIWETDANDMVEAWQHNDPEFLCGYFSFPFVLCIIIEEEKKVTMNEGK